MADITMKELENTDFVQHAELRIPLEKFELVFIGAQAGSIKERVADALAIIAKIRLVAFEFLGVDDENADYTSFEYDGIDGDELVVRVAQVNV